MKHTKKEILDALKVIKEECAFADDCPLCPFRRGEGCAILGGNPEDWTLAKEEPEAWRAFE